jgi:hypothetical protein
MGFVDLGLDFLLTSHVKYLHAFVSSFQSRRASNDFVLVKRASYGLGSLLL